MSDQPKPAGQDNTAFTHDALPEDFEPDQPKPIGEWWAEVDADGCWHIGTGDRGFADLGEGSEPQRQSKLIADAHNAALSAEREKREQIEIAIADLSHPNCQMLLRKEQQLREQLAAEREKHNKELREYESALSGTHLSRIKVLEQQLAAEREKVQTYEGALIKIANDPNCDRCQIAVNALAKVAK